MRYAIIADIHANLTAFLAVLKDIGEKGEADEIWCLGDIIGYGPQPHECIELLRRTNHICVAGNHDLAAIGEIGIHDFNPDAATAVRWTGQQLTAPDAAYIRQLPRLIENGDFTLVHGSPRQPVWEYIMSTDTAQDNFGYFTTEYCLVSHTHAPQMFHYNQKGACVYAQPRDNETFALGRGRLIFNPGAVGQPRDGDPRASYAIYDSDTRKLALHRVAYNIAETQAQMIQHNLPVRLVARLDRGA